MLLLLLHRMQRSVPLEVEKMEQKKKKAGERADQEGDESAEDQDQQCETEQSGKHL